MLTIYLTAGTRAFSSSVQLSTTVMLAGAAGDFCPAGLESLIIRNRRVGGLYRRLDATDRSIQATAVALRGDLLLDHARHATTRGVRRGAGCSRHDPHTSLRIHICRAGNQFQSRL